MNTLLLTGTIKPNNDGKQKSSVLSDENFFNPEYRLKQYLSTIFFYITQSNFDNIVFCENSDYKIKNIQDIQNIANLFGKNLEVLQFKGDKEKIVKYGYGYGEAQIFDYAYENSHFLKISKNWYKITGRYIIRNINQLLEIYKNDDLFFYKGWGISQFAITTAFFKITNIFYKENIYKKYQFFYDKYFRENNCFIPLESYWYFKLRNVLFLNYKIQIKEIPNYIFFSQRAYIFEVIKKYLGLLGFGIMGNLLDKLLYKRLYKKFTSN